MSQVEPLDLSQETYPGRPKILEDVELEYIRTKVEAMAKDMTQFSYSELWRECYRRYNAILKKLLGVDDQSKITITTDDHHRTFHCSKRKIKEEVCDEMNEEFLPLKKGHFRKVNKKNDPFEQTEHVCQSSKAFSNFDKNIVLKPEHFQDVDKFCVSKNSKLEYSKSYLDLSSEDEYSTDLPQDYQGGKSPDFEVGELSNNKTCDTVGKSASTLEFGSIPNLVKYDNTDICSYNDHTQTLELPNPEKKKAVQCRFDTLSGQDSFNPSILPTGINAQSVSNQYSVPEPIPHLKTPMVSTRNKTFNSHFYQKYETVKPSKQKQIFSEHIPVKHQNNINTGNEKHLKPLTNNCKKSVSDLYLNPYVRNYGLSEQRLQCSGGRYHQLGNKINIPNGEQGRIQEISNQYHSSKLCSERTRLSKNMRFRQKNIEEKYRDNILRNLLQYKNDEQPELSTNSTYSQTACESTLHTIKNSEDSSSFLKIIEEACEKMANTGPILIE